MGNYRIVIDAVGGHGVDRSKKDGEVVNHYAEGRTTPDAIAKTLAHLASDLGLSINDAKLIHWPGEESEVTDNLLTGIRAGSF